MNIDGVDKYMPRVQVAIERHIKWPSPEFTDIYNRAYEAVAEAMADADQLLEAAEQERDEAKQRAERLRGVIQMVEYPDGILRNCCPWCGGIDPSKVDWKIRPALDTGHKPDCPRQRALAGE